MIQLTVIVCSVIAVVALIAVVWLLIVLAIEHERIESLANDFRNAMEAKDAAARRVADREGSSPV